MTERGGDRMLTRREALRTTAALCGVALLGAGVSQAAASSAAVQPTRSGQVRVRISAYPALARVGGIAVIPDVRGIPAAVVRLTRKRFIALDLRCTHQGYEVVPGGPGFSCPLHGSQFDPDGDVARGPAGSPLRRFRVRRKRGTLVIG